MKVGLLNAYRFDPTAEYQKAYSLIFNQFFKNVFADEDVREYEVALGGLPKDIKECDVWIISGSPKSAYDPDLWIAELGGFIQKCHKAEHKLIGVCFGHQVIAHYLGGRTERAPQGWGVGVKDFDIRQEREWMAPKLEHVSLLFSHQDQVIKLPPKAELLASSDFCNHQMFSMGEHILCLQGHPEFTSEFARGRMEERRARLGENVYQKAVATLGQKTNSEQLGEWIKKFSAQ